MRTKDTSLISDGACLSSLDRFEPLKVQQQHSVSSPTFIFL